MTSDFFLIPGAEGAFKKLKPDPCASSPHIGHTPTTASCPTPARRRHRTTFTQVCSWKRFKIFNFAIFELRKFSNFSIKLKLYNTILIFIPTFAFVLFCPSIFQKSTYPIRLFQIVKIIIAIIIWRILINSLNYSEELELQERDNRFKYSANNLTCIFHIHYYNKQDVNTFVVCFWKENWFLRSENKHKSWYTKIVC